MNLLVSSHIAVSVILMRILNILLLVGVATVLYVLLPVNRRPSLVWGLAISLVPLGLFLVASNNPGAWAIVSAGTLWISLLGYFESSGKKKAGLGVIAALSTILGAGARADAAVYAVVAIVAVVLLTARLDRRWIISALLPFGMAVTAALFYFSTEQSSFASSGLPGYGDSSHHLDLHYLILANLLNVPDLWVGVFGSGRGLGWLDTSMPTIVWVGGLGCFAALAFAGLASRSIRKLLAVAVVLGALWCIPTLLLVQSGRVLGAGLQPRYILPLVVILGGVLLLQVGQARLTLSSWQVVALVSTLSVVNAVALQFNMRRYITGTDVTRWDLNYAIKWWWNIPASPMIIWAVGSLSFAAFLVIIARATLLTRPTDVPHYTVKAAAPEPGARLEAEPDPPTQNGVAATVV